MSGQISRHNISRIFLLITVFLVTGFFFYSQPSIPPDPLPVPVYVISLLRSVDRRERMKRVLDKIPFSFLDAADGRNLTVEETKLAERFFVSGSLLKGQVGSFISHYTVWKNAVLERTPYTLIFEDDVKLKVPLISTVNKLVQIKIFDVIYLGHLVDKRGWLIKPLGTYSVYTCTNPVAVHAYLLSLHGATTLVEYVENNKIKLPADLLMIDLLKARKLRSLCVHPTMIDAGYAGKSTIEYGAKDPEAFWIAESVNASHSAGK